MATRTYERRSAAVEAFVWKGASEQAGYPAWFTLACSRGEVKSGIKESTRKEWLDCGAGGMANIGDYIVYDGGIIFVWTPRGFNSHFVERAG